MLNAILLIIILSILTIFLLFFSISLLISTFFGAPFIDTESKLIDAIIHLGEPKNNDKFYDLGCGSGKIVAAFAKKLVKQSVGVEISPLAYLMASNRVKKYNNANIILKNFDKLDFSDATIVYCYLFPALVQKLAKRFETELLSGAKVICQDFKIENKIPKKMIKVGRHKLYLYKF